MIKKFVQIVFIYIVITSVDITNCSHAIVPFVKNTIVPVFKHISLGMLEKLPSSLILSPMLFTMEPEFDEELSKLLNIDIESNVNKDNSLPMVKKSILIIDCVHMLIDTPIIVQNVIIDRLCTIIENTNKEQNIYKKNIFYIPRFFFNFPLIISKIILKKAADKKPEINNYKKSIYMYNVFFIIINMMFVKYLYGQLFSRVNKLKYINTFLCEMPWWLKFSIVDHLGEEIKHNISYFKISHVQ